LDDYSRFHLHPYSFLLKKPTFFFLFFFMFWLMVMVFNATFNNISFISWLSVLLVEETGVPGENHQPVGNH
jgi:hypothetical protein